MGFQAHKRKKIIGDIIDVNDFAFAKIIPKPKGDLTIAYLVREQDDSIRWYVNPDERSDIIIDSKFVKFEKER